MARGSGLLVVCLRLTRRDVVKDSGKRWMEAAGLLGVLDRMKDIFENGGRWIEGEVSISLWQVVHQRAIGLEEVVDWVMTIEN